MYRTTQTNSTSFTFTTASHTNKHGFTMIELIGVMIIIAVLTVAGITAVSTAIENSRQTAIQQDLDGFRKVAEQFLLENPQTSKWNGVNNPDQRNQAFKLFNDKYLEGEMKLNLATLHTSGNAHMMARTNYLDPYGNPYDIIYYTRKFLCDSKDLQSTSYARIFIRSRGKNGNNPLDKNPGLSFLSADADDICSITQFSNGRVISTGAKDDIPDLVPWGYSYDTHSWCKLKDALIPGYVW